ncbi:MAG TPA: hypothetical protein VEB67_03805 [Nitrososphaerales archaeon]|nr:hypothetical protein [Nitrososphaerales archaeon]
MRVVNEATMFKVLLEGRGLLLSVTTRRRAYFLFVTGRYVGMKVAPTTDPFAGIVELSGYDIPRILKDWERLSRVKVPHGQLAAN